MSEGKVDSTVLMDERSEGVRSEMSRRHSVARALNIDKEMRRELGDQSSWDVRPSQMARTHARKRGLFECAFRHSTLILFSSSLLNLLIFPGLLAA